MTSRSLGESDQSQRGKLKTPFRHLESTWKAPGIHLRDSLVINLSFLTNLSIYLLHIVRRAWCPFREIRNVDSIRLRKEEESPAVLNIHMSHVNSLETILWRVYKLGEYEKSKSMREKIRSEGICP